MQIIKHNMIPNKENQTQEFHIYIYIYIYIYEIKNNKGQD